MVKKTKKGKEGDVIKYIPRTKAVRKLQISLSQFRRLCILKGIYPVEPKNKRKVNNNSTQLRTFYYKKDIQYLLHEPILEVLRQEKTHARKLGKAINKKETSTIKKLQEDRPTYRLDHIIKERYPTFQDALRDLDDSLSMLALFSTLPSDETIPEYHINECTRLYQEFLNYCIHAGCLEKTFLSIKGIYYQVVIMGQPITWITPYHFSQEIPEDVDFKIMKTFLEVNETLVSFVNYKLYMDCGLVYPPKLDSEKFEAGAGLGSLLMQSKTADTPTVHINKKILKKKIKTLDLEAIENDDSEIVEEDNMDLDDDEEQEEEKPRIFSKCVFWISREVPRYSLEFVIKAMGGQCGWDQSSGGGSLFDFEDSRITHVLTDRAAIQNPREGREYLQPQWVYDCVNQQKFVRTEGYHPGEELPPHLSPFVQLNEDDYDPEREIQVYSD
jgi:pescadillo protein